MGRPVVSKTASWHVSGVMAPSPDPRPAGHSKSSGFYCSGRKAPSDFLNWGMSHMINLLLKGPPQGRLGDSAGWGTAFGSVPTPRSWDRVRP